MSDAMAPQVRLIMVGPALDSPGGMTAVVHSYIEAGLFDRWQVLYIPSYTRPGLLTQVRTIASALVMFLPTLLGREAKLVHLHSASRGSFWRKLIFAYLARAAGVPYIFHLHSGEFSVFYRRECGPLRKGLVRTVLQNAARVVTLSPAMADEISAIAPDASVTTVTNPVDLPVEVLPLRQPGRRLLFLGRLREKKGVFDLVRAFPSVLKRHPEATLCLAGDGDLSGVRHLAEELAVSHAVETPGWIDGEAKTHALERADVLVLPSYYEGVPVCVLEAMSHGVPVVATSVGGTEFVLDGGACGRLVVPGDVAGLARALDVVLGDAQVRKEMVARARARIATTFTKAVVAEQIEQIWLAGMVTQRSASPTDGGNKGMVGK